MAKAKSRSTKLTAGHIEKSEYFFVDIKPDPEKSLTVVCGGREVCSPDYVIDRDNFAHHTIEFVLKGRGEFYLEGQKYELTAGSVFAYMPGMKHSIVTDENDTIESYFVCFAGTNSKALLEQCCLERGGALELVETHWFETIFDQLVETGLRKEDECKSHCALLLKTLISRIVIDSKINKKNDTPARDTFVRCKQHAIKNFLKLSTATQWAQECHLDKAYLSRLFKRFSYQSPHKFLIQLKISHAAYLMLRRGFSAKRAGIEVGISDPQHFSTVFKRVYGSSPKNFLKLSK